MKNEWKKIRPARLSGGIRQADLALAAGVSQVAISRIETGKLQATAGTLADIIAALEKLAASRKN